MLNVQGDYQSFDSQKNKASARYQKKKEAVKPIDIEKLVQYNRDYMKNLEYETGGDDFNADP